MNEFIDYTDLVCMHKYFSLGFAQKQKMDRVLLGWQYSPRYSNYIGMRVRIYDPLFCDGFIDSYLPAYGPNDKDLWHVVLDDEEKGDLDVTYTEMVDYRLNYMSNSDEFAASGKVTSNSKSAVVKKSH